MRDASAMREWIRWRKVCMLLKQRGIDVNESDHEVLCQTIRAWGDAYLDLFDGTGDRSPHAARDAQVADALTLD